MVKGNKLLIRQNTFQIYYFPLTKLVIEEHSSTTIKQENKLRLKLMKDTQTHTDRQDKNIMPQIFDTGGIIKRS